jgi:predicted membrane-bound mannosyltransferase
VPEAAAATAGDPGQALGAVTLPKPKPAAPARRRTKTAVDAPPVVSAVPEPVAPALPGTRRHTGEHALYAILIVAAVVTRFWDLGTRALHHDESLHAYYSWLFATGQGYVHDPLMHGPFLFVGNALVYLLFGDSDASSRYLPALAGVMLVGLPYLLRGPRHLGRWGALAASALFLISPSFLYYSRYIRHDIYSAVGTLLLFICIVRYLEKPERRWLVAGGATLGYLLTNHEVVFVVLFAFGLFLWGALLWGRLRPLLPLQIGMLVLAAALWIVFSRLLDRPLPSIPWANPTNQQSFEYAQDLLTHPLVVSLLLVLAAFLVAAWIELARVRNPQRADEGRLVSLLDGAPEGSVEAGILHLRRDRAGLYAALGSGAAIFVVLFTTLLTNLPGLASGTFGALFYWLGQHNVHRGEQPWFYYLLLLPQSEFVAVLFGGAAAALTVWRAVRRQTANGKRQTADGRWREDETLFFRLFVVVWFVVMFVTLSIAGEKMPWLILHIALPLTLLAASLIGELVERASALRLAVWPSRRLAVSPSGRLAVSPEPVLFVALLLSGAGWFFLAGRLSYGTFDGADRIGRSVTAAALDRWWLLAIPPAVALALLIGHWLWRGSTRTGQAALAAIVVGLALLQVHAAWRVNYLEGDVPKDMLIYNTTTPDVTRMMHELDALSAELTGGKGLVIWYDSGTSWPLHWYLRDFPNKVYFGDSLSAPPSDAPVLIVANDRLGGVEPYMDGYTAQSYVLRWHFPEEGIYRNFAIAPEIPPGRSAWTNPDDPHGPIDIIGSIVDSFATQLSPDGQQRVYRLLMFRDLPVPIFGYNFTVFVRDDLLPFFNDIRY